MLVSWSADGKIHRVIFGSDVCRCLSFDGAIKVQVVLGRQETFQRMRQVLVVVGDSAVTPQHLRNTGTSPAHAHHTTRTVTKHKHIRICQSLHGLPQRALVCASCNLHFFLPFDRPREHPFASRLYRKRLADH